MIETRIVCVGKETVGSILSEKLTEAVKFLKEGFAIAIPTETVYGLAANALSASACKKIFQAKNRPSDNPLIVHVSSVEMLHTVIEGEIPLKTKALIDKFWPGPLTLLFKKNQNVPDEVTCGQPTVAVRMPSHPVARHVIEMCGFPLAAPSANSSGKPSPTLASHVFDDLNGKIPFIIDGGQCDCGVESTVVDPLRNPAVILRPGGISYEALSSVVPDIQVYKKHFTDKALEERPSTPGMKYKHYSPNAQVILFEGPQEMKREKILSKYRELLEDGKKVGIMRTSAVPFSTDKNEIYLGLTLNDAAREIFKSLRTLDKLHTDYILVEGVEEIEEGLAVMNRLRKAASLIIE